MQHPNFDILLFDLGGVLIELSGVDTMLNWLGGSVSEPEMWRMWLASPAVRRFESGCIPPDRFAQEMVAEFDLPVDAAVFLAAFERWPKRPFEGAIPLLSSLQQRFHLACLSNTNTLHWARIRQQMALASLFRSRFLSFRTGLLKPDTEVYLHVIRTLDRPPERILFLDDNHQNVATAAAVGMTACQAAGVGEVAAALKRHGIPAQNPPPP